MQTLTKELHQQKWMAMAGCLVGLIFPVIEYWLFYKAGTRHESYSGAYVVLLGGAFFGILLALATGYHDARKGARDFLLARPFNCSRIFITKTLIAAVTLPLTLAIIAAPDLITNFGQTEHFAFAWAAFTVTWPIALALFSLTVFLVVLTQDQARSLILAVWAGVLIYLLPPFLSGFRWLNVPKYIEYPGQSVLLHLLGPRFQALVPDLPRDHYGRPMTFIFEWKEMLPYLAFISAMTAATIIFTWLAAIAAKRRWHWQPGRKTVVWAVGLASLLISTQLIFHVGYNLRPAREVAGRQIQNPIRFNAEQALTARWQARSESTEITTGFGPGWGAIYSQNDLLFAVVCCYERVKDPNGGKARYIQHNILCTYRFPYMDDSRQPSGNEKDFLISTINLFTSPSPIAERSQSRPYGGHLKDGWLYACYAPHAPDPENPDWTAISASNLSAVGISNPAAPALGPTIAIPLDRRNIMHRGFAVKGDYCYIHAQYNLAIVSIATPGEPRLVKEVPFASLTPMTEQAPIPLGASITRLTVSGDLLLATTGVHLAAFDISEPTEPRTLFFEELWKLDIAKEPYYFVSCWNGEYCYLADGDGIYVVRIIKSEDGSYSLKRVGGRKATHLEKLARREPRQLLVHGRYLIEAAGDFGLLVYDISNPARPKRAYHADVPGCENVGIWNGLLYTCNWYGDHITFFDLPKAP